jgi:hypothetical protein
MRTPARLGLCVVLLLAIAGVGTSSALAASPWWHLRSSTLPTYLAPGGKGYVVLTAANLGDANANPPVTIADILPPGLHATAIEGTVDESKELGFGVISAPLECSLGSLSCTFTSTNPPGFTAPYPKFVPPYLAIRVRIAVKVVGASSGEVNQASVTGGGTPAAATRQPITVSATPPPFGVSTYEVRPEAEGGGPDTQAGSHPFQLTTTFNLNETPESRPVGLAKDLHFKLPPGLIGNPSAIPRCTLGQFLNFQPETGTHCPAQTVVGVAQSAVNLFFPAPEPSESRVRIPVQEPVYNLEPAVGEPARFGLIVHEIPVLLTTSVRTGGDYGVTVNVTNITQQAEFLSSEVTFWGVPGNEAHNNARGFACLRSAKEAAIGEQAEYPPCPAFSEQGPPPFLSLPTSCPGTPLQTSVEADSWEEPHDVLPFSNTAPMQAMDGCNRLPFEPQIYVEKIGARASVPVAPTVDVHVPQDGQQNAEGLAQSDVKTIRVVLPAGVALNPSAAYGLQSCPEGLVGFEAGLGVDGFEEFEPGLKTPLFTPRLPVPLKQGVNFCPDASKVANVTIKTPLLPEGQLLKGAIYVATQGQNPFGSLVALYLVAEDPVSGILVKLPGKVSLNESTGQIESVFEAQPQAPFEDAKIEFFDGNRSSLASPALCGTYTTEAQFTPWSGGPPQASSASFAVTQDPAGGPCPHTAAEEPNSPAFTAGTENPVAGAYSPLVVHLKREDGSQAFSQVSVTLPPGATGKLAGIPECSDAQIAQAQARGNPGEGATEAQSPSCPGSSAIGTVTVAAGYGPEPFFVTGKAYLAGPYKGAPYSAVFITPAVAGPFDLGVVVVRAGLYIDPTTAQVTTKSDPLPTILHGIPLDVRSISVNVNRPEFTLNPTSCAPMQITGEEISTQGAVAPLSARFQVGSCASLAFHPQFTASTQGHTSKQNGASLRVRIGFHPGQANIHKVELTIPNILPSRLTTLQKACPEAQFNTNPAGCPSASLIATAIAHTPLLPDPLSGPVYFVSHGGAAFPDTVMVLQGDNVKLQVVGHTDIKKGVTYSRFETVPDAPVTSFEFNAPEGPYSIFGSNGNLCQTEVRMPTTITAQNGAVLTQSTLVEPEGCSNTLTILSHRVKKRTVTLKVVVPSAGKLTASGKGLTSGSKTAGARSTVTITLNAKGHGKLNTKVKLTFTPTKGRKLTAAIAARFKH